MTKIGRWFISTSDRMNIYVTAIDAPKEEGIDPEKTNGCSNDGMKRIGVLNYREIPTNRQT